MYYKIQIEPNNAEISAIEFTTNPSASGDDEVKASKITGFAFKMNSDDESIERDQQARCEMRLRGRIDQYSCEKTQKLAEWSLKTENFFAKVTVELVVGNDQPKTIRTYIFDRMFCVDYSEDFGDYDTAASASNKADSGCFELFMAQGPDNNQHNIF